MGLAVTSQDAIDHEVHTMDFTVIYNGSTLAYNYSLAVKVVYNSPTVSYNEFLSVTVAYNDPFGVRVVYNSPPDLSVI